MLNGNFLDSLTKIEFEVGRKRNVDNAVTITTNKNAMTISANLVRELGWGDGTRLDLLHIGTLFVLKPAKAGLVTLRITKAKTWDQAKIYSKNMCLEIMSRCKSNRFYEGEIQDGMLLFRPKKGEDE